MCELFSGAKVEQVFLHIQVKIPYNYKLQTTNLELTLGALIHSFLYAAHITAYL